MKWLSLHIGGQEWGVYRVKGTSKLLGGHDECACDGITYLDKCRVYLSKDVSDGVLEDTLVHELFHASLYVSGAANVLNDLCKGDAKKFERAEEQIVRCLTPVWHRLLKDLGFRFPKGPTE